MLASRLKPAFACDTNTMQAPVLPLSLGPGRPARRELAHRPDEGSCMSAAPSEAHGWTGSSVSRPRRRWATPTPCLVRDGLSTPCRQPPHCAATHTRAPAASRRPSAAPGDGPEPAPNARRERMRVRREWLRAVGGIAVLRPPAGEASCPAHSHTGPCCAGPNDARPSLLPVRALTVAAPCARCRCPAPRLQVLQAQLLGSALEQSLLPVRHDGSSDNGQQRRCGP